MVKTCGPANSAGDPPDAAPSLPTSANIRDAPRERSGGRIGRQFLLQPQSPGQPMHERIVKVQHQSKLRDRVGEEIAAANVRDFMRQNRPPLRCRPRPPIRRQQNHRPPPTDRRRERPAGPTSSNCHRFAGTPIPPATPPPISANSSIHDRPARCCGTIARQTTRPPIAITPLPKGPNRPTQQCAATAMLALRGFIGRGHRHALSSASPKAGEPTHDTGEVALARCCFSPPHRSLLRLAMLRPLR